MADRPISELYVALVDWAIANGAEKIDRLPGLWTGETSQWNVAINGHKHEVDGVPPFGYQLTHKTALVGAAVGGPFGGVLAGPSEADIIAHFRAATPASP